MQSALLRVTLAACLMPASVDAHSLVHTESEALARLSAESPRVRAIRASIDIARADVLAAARWPNPRLIFDHESVAGITENLTMVSQTLPITGVRTFKVRSAATLVEATEHRAEEEVRRARTDLRLTFAQLVAAQIRERELSRTLDRLRDLASVLSKREAAGESAGFDRLRAEREVVDVETDRALAAAERARAQVHLTSFFADPVSPATLVASEAAVPRTALPPIEALIDRAETSRGELLALRQEEAAAELAERAAGRRAIPEPEIIAGTKSSTFGGGDIGVVVTLQGTLPLFDRGQPERALARARANEAHARAAVVRVTLRADIAAWRAAVIDRRKIADQYRGAAVASAAELERIAQVSYEAGERGILELLDAHRAGSTARVRQAALDASVREAEIELEFVSGWEISK